MSASSLFSTKPITTNYRMKSLGWNLAIVAILLWVAWQSRGFRWNVVWQNWHFLLKGLANSWILTILSISFGMLAGILLAAGRMYGARGVRNIATVVIEAIRAIPQLMVIFWVYFTSPILTHKVLDSWLAALIALSLIAAAYLAEVVRAGLISVPRVQNESAYATGLNPKQTFIFVILPQALRNMLPAFVATFVMLFKITSLVYVIGVIDFFRAATLVNNRDIAPYALYTTLVVVYFICCFVLSSVIRKLDPKYDLTTT